MHRPKYMTDEVQFLNIIIRKKEFTVEIYTPWKKAKFVVFYVVFV